MMGINIDLIQLVKERKIDCIDGWINALAILVYIDIFLGILQQRGEQIEKISDNFTLGNLILFIIVAIVCVLVIKVITFSLYVLYLGIIAQYVEKFFYPREHHDYAVSVDKLREYAMMNNNKVVAEIADEAEKKETKHLRNTLVIVGTLILICFDIYQKGTFLSKIATEPFDRLAIIVVCILIGVGLLQSLYGRKAQVFIFSDELREKIEGRKKTYIANE